MLMAVESSKLFADTVAAIGLESPRLQAEFTMAFERHFRSRLGISRSISRAAYEPTWSTAIVRLLSASGTLRAMLARKTRAK